MDLMKPRIDAFLKGKRIALLGATNKTDKWGYKIYKVLRRLGYKVFPVHPTIDSLEGDRVYKSLADIGEPVDGVNMVIPPSATDEAVRAVKKLGLARVWLQPGAESDDAIEFCEQNGIECIHHKCILVETGSA